jgi:hypothetical protein
MDRSQLLDKIEKAWQDLKSSYLDLPESELLEAGVTGTWSVKDIIAHVTSWEEEALKHLPHIEAGERPPKYSVVYGGIDAFNALTVDQTRALPLSEVLARRDETHRRLVEYLQAVPEEEVATETRFRRRLRLDTYGHYPKHTEAILLWRGKRGPD